MLLNQKAVRSWVKWGEGETWSTCYHADWSRIARGRTGGEQGWATRGQIEVEVSTETQPRKEELNGGSTDEESRPKPEKTKKSQEDKIKAGAKMGLQSGKESTKQLEEGQEIGQQEENINAAGQAGTSKNENGEDLQPNVSTSCLASSWVCVFPPCVCVFCCCCSGFWKSFRNWLKPGFSDFTDGLVFIQALAEGSPGETWTTTSQMWEEEERVGEC